MRTVLSEQAVATMGRCGCGWLDQARELEGGVRVASGVIVEGIVVGVLWVSRRWLVRGALDWLMRLLVSIGGGWFVEWYMYVCTANAVVGNFLELEM